jgi:dipeptidyl aminopeptidase/acylaminoacyl peptidase
MEQANYDFGDGRVQQDIIDGIEYVLSRGVGDRQKLGITGTSFGGFSTLAALTFTPDMFSVGVAVKPPTDMGKAITFIKKTNPTQRRTQDIQDLLFNPNDPQALETLYEKSPDHHSNKVTAPMYIMAGGVDQRVSVLNVKDYALRQFEAGKPVTLIVVEHEEHGFSNDITLEAYLYFLEKAFADHLGGNLDAKLSVTLKRFLKRSILIDENKFQG